MKDKWLDFDDLHRAWVERAMFEEARLPLMHTIESLVESHFVAAFLVPDRRVESVKMSTSIGWQSLQASHPILSEGRKHFVSANVRRSMELELKGWDTYVAGGKTVVERKSNDSTFVKESGVYVDRTAIVDYAKRVRLRLGFVVDSIRYTERQLSEVGAIDDGYDAQHAHFRRLRQDDYVVCRPRMVVRSIFWGKAFH